MISEMLLKYITMYLYHVRGFSLVSIRRQKWQKTYM